MIKKLWTFTGHVAYWLAHPLLAVYFAWGERARVMVIHDDKILLVRSWLDTGSWYLPGGGLKSGEDPAHGASRELREETGIEVDVLTDLGTFLFKRVLIQYRYHLFRVRLDGEIALHLQKHEISDAAWFSRDNIAQIKIDDELRKLIFDYWK